MCRFWNRLVKLDECRLPKKILHFEYLNDGNNKSWYQMFKGILPLLGIDDINMFYHFDLGLLNTKLTKQAETDWKEEIRKKPKLRSYRQFKKCFETQNYVTQNLSKYQRSLTAKLCLGILPLALETGRFTNTPLTERKCFHCNDEIEDEFHFVCQCNLYKNLRETLYESMSKVCLNFNQLSDRDRFLTIMECDHRSLHMYIVKAWNIRKTHLYETLSQ